MGASKGDRDKPRRFLEAAAAHGIDLTHLWASVEREGGVPRQVCLAVVGAGRSAMVFTSTPRSAPERAELAGVIDRACAEIPGLALAQTLLETHETGAGEAFLGAGFISVGDLAYLRRPRAMASDPKGTTDSLWPAGVEGRRYEVGDEDLFVRALDRSYADTLDCPELCGLRSTRDVLDSHRATGRFDPNLWRVLLWEGEPHGAILLNPSPEQDSIELVYLGLSPALRGRGLGAALLRWGVALVRERSEAFIACAVDQRNEPALRVYRRLGFAEFASRRALVRPSARRAEVP